MTAPVTWRIGNAGRSIPIRAGGTAIAKGVTRPGTVWTDPYLAPPDGATTFNFDTNQAITGAGARFNPAALKFKIPDDCYGVISSLSLLLNGIVLTSNVLWQINVNNAAVPGYNALTILGRDGAASVSKSYDGPLRITIPLGGVVSVTIIDVDGGAYTAGTTLYGWFWPQER